MYCILCRHLFSTEVVFVIQRSGTMSNFLSLERDDPSKTTHRGSILTHKIHINKYALTSTSFEENVLLLQQSSGEKN